VRATGVDTGGAEPRRDIGAEATTRAVGAGAGAGEICGEGTDATIRLLEAGDTEGCNAELFPWLLAGAGDTELPTRTPPAEEVTAGAAGLLATRLTVEEAVAP
jgi:hypothetical protein